MCTIEKDEIEFKNFVERITQFFYQLHFQEKLLCKKNECKGAYKIGSGECNHLPLIELIASFGKPMIVSTGMNDIKSISKTVKILDKYRVQYALLHYTNVYPTPPNIVGASCINDLQLKFKKQLLDIQDHTINNNACKSSNCTRISIVERHYTDVKSKERPDIIVNES